MERIGIALEPLKQRVTSLMAGTKMVGTVAGGRGAAQVAALQRGVPWVKNLWDGLAESVRALRSLIRRRPPGQPVKGQKSAILILMARSTNGVA